MNEKKSFEQMTEDELNNEMVEIEKDIKQKKVVMQVVKDEYNIKRREILVLQRDIKDKEILKGDLGKSIDTQKFNIEIREHELSIATKLFWQKRRGQ